MSIGSDIELHVFEEFCHHAVPAMTLGIDVLGSWDEKPWRLHHPSSMPGYANRYFQPHVTDLWCAASGPWPIPPPMQCRLLDEHLSHTVGPVELDEDGPADFDPQDLEVSFEEEEDLSFLLAGFSPEEGTAITLEMYGLLITHHSIRSETTSGDIASIKETIRRTWSDIIPRHGLMNAFLLKPQDLTGANITQILVEIVPPEIRIPPIDVPILRRTKWYSDDSTTVETAYMRDMQTGYEILVDAGHLDWCFSARNIQCNLHIEGRIAFLSLRHPLRQGAVLSFFIHDDWVAPSANAIDDPHVTLDEASLLDLSRQTSIKGLLVPNEHSAAAELRRLKGNSASGTSDPLSCALGTAKHDLAIRELKPNPGIPPDLDGVVPHRQRNADGHVIIGRTIAPPNWQTNGAYRAAAESGSLFRDDADDLRIRIRSWIASVRTQLILPHRDFTIRAQLMGDLEIRLQRAWRDQIQQTDRVKFTVVRPSLPTLGTQDASHSMCS